jgi:hypothetical protein
LQIGRPEAGTQAGDRSKAYPCEQGLFRRLSELSGKAGLAKNMVAWYYSGIHQTIENYVTKEVQDFLKMYFILRMVLPRIIVTSQIGTAKHPKAEYD